MVIDDAVGRTFHNKSVLHREYRRIVALLSRPCVDFKTIASRIGVSRERVRQIAGELDMARGYDRMVVCTLTRKQLAWREWLKTSLLGRFIQELDRRDIEWRYVPATAFLWRKDFLVAAGKLVKVKRAYPCRDGRHYYRATAGDPTAYATVYEMPEGEGWMIIPTNKRIRQSTMFTLHPDLHRTGSTNARHDFVAMLNDWVFLKTQTLVAA